MLALAPAKRAQAEAELQRIAALDSSARQALVLRAFGERTDAADRARELLASCPSLGAELRSELPPRYRPQGWTCASKPATRARAALCERLVREALQ